MSDAANQARKIVEEFEGQFGDLPPPEREWLFQKIRDAIQGNRDIGRMIGWDAAKRNSSVLLDEMLAAR